MNPKPNSRDQILAFVGDMKKRARATGSGGEEYAYDVVEGFIQWMTPDPDAAPAKSAGERVLALDCDILHLRHPGEWCVVNGHMRGTGPDPRVGSGCGAPGLEGV
jgi:hypothetical protein